MDRLTDIVYRLWREMPIALDIIKTILVAIVIWHILAGDLTVMLYGDVDTSVVGEVTATQEYKKAPVPSRFGGFVLSQLRRQLPSVPLTLVGALAVIVLPPE